MEKQQRWRLVVILAVLGWTLYSIFPTIIYYSKPLSQPVDENGAKAIELEIAERVNSLVPEAEKWLQAFGKLIGVHPSKIVIDPTDSSIITFEVASPEEASLVQRFLPRAGMMVPFKPAQIFLDAVNGKSIRVNRHVSTTMDVKSLQEYFAFLWKRDKEGHPTESYVNLVVPRFVEVAFACSGASPQATALSTALQKNDSQALERIASDIVDWKETLSSDSALTTRLLQNLVQEAKKIEALIAKLNSEAASLQSERTAAQADQDAKIAKDEVVSADSLDRVKKLTIKIDQYHSAAKWLEAQKSNPMEKVQPFTREELRAWVRQIHVNGPRTIYTLPLGDRNPLISSAAIDWTQDHIRIELHPDVTEILLESTPSTESAARLKDAVSAMVMNEVARISRQANETLKSEGASYAVSLSRSPTANGLITLRLDRVASSLSTSMLDVIAAQWEPQSPDLTSEALPRLTAEQYQKAPFDVRKLCLLVFSPTSSHLFEGQLKSGSLYVIVRGGVEFIGGERGSERDPQVEKDLDGLTAMLERRGFVAYPGKALSTPEFTNDVIFELDRFYQPLLEATREAFYVPGVGATALLECGTWEQRIAAENHIDDSTQEELVKWAENYQAAQVSLQPGERYTVPPPTRSVFWSNLGRSWRKYWRGDDSRIIRWGLDLSGGKSVRVGLLNQANRPVTKMDDLKQATSELYSRLNKMGVSERTLRIENGTILIDFPGVQGVSASELVKASAMYFHVVNEKFGLYNSDLSKSVNGFLQEIWNEAVVTNCTDGEGINKIALRRIAEHERKEQEELLSLYEAALGME